MERIAEAIAGGVATAPSEMTGAWGLPYPGARSRPLTEEQIAEYGRHLNPRLRGPMPEWERAPPIAGPLPAPTPGPAEPLGAEGGAAQADPEFRLPPPREGYQYLAPIGATESGRRFIERSVNRMRRQRRQAEEREREQAMQPEQA